MPSQTSKFDRGEVLLVRKGKRFSYRERPRRVAPVPAYPPQGMTTEGEAEETPPRRERMTTERKKLTIRRLVRKRSIDILSQQKPRENYQLRKMVSQIEKMMNNKPLSQASSSRW